MCGVDGACIVIPWCRLPLMETKPSVLMLLRSYTFPCDFNLCAASDLTTWESGVVFGEGMLRVLLLCLFLQSEQST